MLMGFEKQLIAATGLLYTFACKPKVYEDSIIYPVVDFMY